MLSRVHNSSHQTHADTCDHECSDLDMETIVVKFKDLSFKVQNSQKFIKSPVLDAGAWIRHRSIIDSRLCRMSPILSRSHCPLFGKKNQINSLIWHSKTDKESFYGFDFDTCPSHADIFVRDAYYRIADLKLTVKDITITSRYLKKLDPF